MGREVGADPGRSLFALDKALDAALDPTATPSRRADTIEPRQTNAVGRGVAPAEALAQLALAAVV